MTVEDLQQYLFRKANDIRKKGSLNGNDNPEYKRALQEISEELIEERDELIKSIEILKKYNLK